MRAYALVMVTVFLFAGNYIVGKVAADVVPPLTLTWMRTLLGLILVFAFYRKKIMLVRRQLIKEWRPILGMAVTGIAFFPSLSYLALHYTSTINASIMESLTPAVTIILGFFFLRETYGKRQIAGVGLSLVGVMYIISDGSLETLLSLSFNSGDLIMMGAVICWATYSTFVNKFGYRIPLYGSLFAMLLIGNFIIMFAAFLFEWSQGRFVSEWSGPIVFSILYTGVFPSFLALLSWNMAVAEIGPAKATVFMNFMPFATAILSLLFLQEIITVSQIIGGLIVLTGIYFTTKVKKRPRTPPQESR
ncbi:DMT family transporter [Salimicrobium halophilum]|uniref:Permease of the drug/metabolite transporter (DMT) superfamily n=1 Tax=Salimicrobium halophilum TaxID=86666 RepID=A0A1G8UNA0_9BACI|nr:DMT family transporter [Salimicrobium halophilum]SDJ55312.1 Permease of the drug/metabolite transporter (DMT) superfamily [Salimicrobium halophilum]